MIVEAKRGWNLPFKEQLRLYLPALLESRGAGKDARFVILSQWGETELVRKQLGDAIEGIPDDQIATDRRKRTGSGSGRAPTADTGN